MGPVTLVVWLIQSLKPGNEALLALASLVGLVGLLMGIIILTFIFSSIERNFWLSNQFSLPPPLHRRPRGRAIVWAIAGPLAVLAYTLFLAQPAPVSKERHLEEKAKPDATREVIETVVFVVVLVLMLKSFVAEAFVIPTGSMAETLWGYQKVIACPKCGHQFPVNCSQEVDPQDGRPQLVQECICPNCRWKIQNMVDMGEVPYPPHTGDRVLVAKFLYDLPWKAPDRLDVVVFKFPMRPQVNYVPMNYIKRLVGQPGETIAIYYGKLYYLSPEEGPKYNDSRVKPEDLWRHEYMHEDEAVDLFKRFKIVRKPPAKILSERRLVYDNDHPASDLKDQPRWLGVEADQWKASPAGTDFTHIPGNDGKLSWLRYQNILRYHGPKPQLITDFMGYNAYFSKFDNGRPDNPWIHMPPQEHWVGDLLLECTVTIEKAAGQFVMELSRGTDRFRARWDLSTGTCSLQHLKKYLEAGAPADDANTKWDTIGTAATTLKNPGTYRLRFGNIDNRLILWVNGSLPFEEGVSYEPSDEPGPYPNDLQPASLGVQGAALKVGHLKLWRDTYYTKDPNSRSGDFNQVIEDWGDPQQWGPMRQFTPKTLYVQPGHYLCMGDNSPESSDGRSWGTVPERLLLGRALAVYYPFYCPIWPFNAPVNRVGPIE